MGCNSSRQLEHSRAGSEAAPAVAKTGTADASHDGATPEAVLRLDGEKEDKLLEAKGSKPAVQLRADKEASSGTAQEQSWGRHPGVAQVVESVPGPVQDVPHSATAPPPSSTAAAGLSPARQADKPAAPPASGPAAQLEHFAAPEPPNEDTRMEALCALGVLDTPPDPRFDDITKLVCSIFKVPIALVSLVDKERQWFKSVVGLNTNQTDRKSSFCAWTLLPLHPEVLVVQNALEDIRFKNNPLVTGDPFIKFYAGAPLVTSTGHRLGSLCLIDRKPRSFDAENCNLLCNFAEVVVREIEKERIRMNENLRISRQTSGLLRAMDCFSEGIMLVDTSSPSWRIMFINDAWSRITGIQKEAAMSEGMWDLFIAVGHASKEEAQEDYTATVQKQVAFTMDLARDSSSASALHFMANFRPAASEALDSSMPLIGIPGSVEWQSENVEAYYFATVQVKRLSMESLAPKYRPHTLMPKKEPFDDVALGPLLGQGAFGRVYRGIWNGAVVAVKIIQHTQNGATRQGGGSGSGAGLGTSESLEAVLTTELAHPNIVRTFKSTTRPIQTLAASDVCGGMDNIARFNETWLVLEFCDKGSLQDAVDRGWFTLKDSVGANGRPLPDVPKVINTAREIAGAMWYLHSHSILHGDLAGGNILLVSSDKDERGFSIKVADFGLSRVLSQESISTGTFGTVSHMPPELLTTGKLSKATDVYAFGVLLWEMYTGQRPWAGLLQMQIIFHVTIQNKKLEFPTDAPPLLVDLAARCMDSDPDKRPRFEEIMKILGFDQL